MASVDSILVSVDSKAAASVVSTAEVSGVVVGTSWPNAKTDMPISIIENIFFIIFLFTSKV
jgi:hypothetical protein